MQLVELVSSGALLLVSMISPPVYSSSISL